MPKEISRGGHYALRIKRSPRNTTRISVRLGLNAWLANPLLF